LVVELGGYKKKGRHDTFKNKNRGQPRLWTRIITEGSALKKRLDYRLSVIKFAPADYGRKDYIIVS